MLLVIEEPPVSFDVSFLKFPVEIKLLILLLSSISIVGHIFTKLSTLIETINACLTIVEILAVNPSTPF